LSNGIMFPLEAQYDGKMLDKAYVQQRSRWEPLYEATQIKGDGETHSFLSANRFSNTSLLKALERYCRCVSRTSLSTTMVL